MESVHGRLRDWDSTSRQAMISHALLAPQYQLCGLTSAAAAIPNCRGACQGATHLRGPASAAHAVQRDSGAPLALSAALLTATHPHLRQRRGSLETQEGDCLAWAIFAFHNQRCCVRSVCRRGRNWHRAVRRRSCRLQCGCIACTKTQMRRHSTSTKGLYCGRRTFVVVTGLRCVTNVNKEITSKKKEQRERESPPSQKK